MDMKTLTEAANLAFATIQPEGHVVVEYNETDYDTPAWTIDTPCTGKFDVVEYPGKRTLKTIAGEREVACLMYQVIFFYEDLGTRWTPPETIDKVIADEPNIFAAMSAAVLAVVNERLGNAAESFYWSTTQAVEEV